LICVYVCVCVCLGRGEKFVGWVLQLGILNTAAN